MTEYVVPPWRLRARDIGIFTSRQTLGVEGGRRESCNVCSNTTEAQPQRSMVSGIPPHTYIHEAQEGVNVSRINISGNWSYLCDDCFQTLWMIHQGEDITGRVVEGNGR